MGQCLPGESDFQLRCGRMKTLLRNPFLCTCLLPSGTVVSQSLTSADAVVFGEDGLFSISVCQSAPSAIACSVENAMRRVPIIACVSSAWISLQSWQGFLSASFQGLFTCSSHWIVCRRWLPIPAWRCSSFATLGSAPFYWIVFQRAHHASRARTFGDALIAISSSAVRSLFVVRQRELLFPFHFLWMQSACVVVGASRTPSTRLRST